MTTTPQDYLSQLEHAFYISPTANFVALSWSFLLAENSHASIFFFSTMVFSLDCWTTTIKHAFNISPTANFMALSWSFLLAENVAAVTLR